MKRFLLSKQIYHIVRVGLGMVFLISGLMKAVDPLAFSKVIEAFALLPVWLCLPAAVVIICAEIVCGAGLLFDLKGSLGAVLVLLFCFVTVLGYALYMGYDIDCGCFGPDDPEARAFHSLKTSLTRDLLMIALVVYLYILRVKNKYSPLPIKISGIKALMPAKRSKI